MQLSINNQEGFSMLHQVKRQIERAKATLKTLDDLWASEYGGDARKAFEASFKQPPTYLREQEVLRHLRALDRVDVRAW
jgi:hypothetical protein